MMNLKMKISHITLGILILLLGIVIGGYIFTDTQRRSVFALHECKDTCLSVNELLGLIGSVGIQNLPTKFNPMVIKETEKTVVIDSPIKKAPIHYIVIPKKDIKDIADMSQENTEYVVDAFAVIGSIVQEKGLFTYKVYTNGPGYQTVNYLHFHLLAEKAE